MSVFTVEARDRIRALLLERARADARVTAAAEVGSLALGGGDRWSDLDLTFGLAEGTTPLAILEAWTPELEREFNAIPLFDLPYRSSLYRVFLFPGHLQVDLSFTPGHEFGAIGPRFKLLFGSAVEKAPLPPASPRHLFGLAVHHALRARFCIERGRLWQAQYWIGQIRDEGFALACLRRDLPAAHARGIDDLPVDVKAAFEGTLVRSLDREELMRALRSAIEALLAESGAAGDLVPRAEMDLRGLLDASWPRG